MKRFVVIDYVRGIAACAVIFFHWQHFPVAINLVDWSWSDFPFFDVLGFLYLRGWLAVDLFFYISGFIFAGMYLARIQDLRLGFFSFIWLRVSRLYPLHLITLFVVVLLGFLFSLRYGYVPLSENNDLKHFLANIFLVSSWGVVRGHSFNTPSWSISIEVFLYLIFFLVARIVFFRYKIVFLLLFLVFFGFVVFFHLSTQLGRGLIGFFGGQLLWLVHSRCRNFVGYRLSIYRIALISGFFLGTFIVVFSYSGLRGMVDYSSQLYFVPEGLAWVFLVFPSLLLVCASIDESVDFIVPSVLGDISYSVYLWHLPLQLVFVYMAGILDFPKDFYTSELFFCAFFFVLLCLSYLSWRCFEVPTQKWLRSYFK